MPTILITNDDGVSSSGLLAAYEAAEAQLAGTPAGEQLAALRAEIDRFRTLLLAQPQVLVTWAAGSDEPGALWRTEQTPDPTEAHHVAWIPTT